MKVANITELVKKILRGKKEMGQYHKNF